MNSPKTLHTGTSNQHQKQVIGILGGTFDPIHYGHLKPAKQTANWLGLQQIILLPARIPAHKEGTYAKSTQRVDMVKLACKTDPLFKLDTREIQRNTISYTVETLAELKKEQPDNIIYFLIGSDSLLTFQEWHRWQDILSLCHLVVNARPGYDLTTLDSSTQALLNNHQVNSLSQLKEKEAGCIIFSPDTFHESNLFDISSTDIREMLKQNITLSSPIQDNNHHALLPIEVAQYIIKHQLYR